MNDLASGSFVLDIASIRQILHSRLDLSQTTAVKTLMDFGKLLCMSIVLALCIFNSEFGFGKR
ncbi:hypothetical protein VF14_29070 [Nostoc linckia z18]|uniref:Uncharacterized protein n=1 Tax=Nostoc linckia z7 TaxID=1628745 RepID=A0ABX4KH55_NOSLI|nr:hypothetical protein VF04_27755 [Nostoc linckia z7]PHK22097.1 hypothetical protein VF10_17155 [Nostoc linckia z13]PHK30129.1 hypothetical protein VF14_29070 [Nostoc linckia z18]